jgi:hypothetical protein
MRGRGGRPRRRVGPSGRLQGRHEPRLAAAAVSAADEAGAAGVVERIVAPPGHDAASGAKTWISARSSRSSRRMRSREYPPRPGALASACHACSHSCRRRSCLRRRSAARRQAVEHVRRGRPVAARVRKLPQTAQPFCAICSTRPARPTVIPSSRLAGHRGPRRPQTPPRQFRGHRFGGPPGSPDPGATAMERGLPSLTEKMKPIGSILPTRPFACAGCRPPKATASCMTEV